MDQTNYDFLIYLIAVIPFLHTELYSSAGKKIILEIMGDIDISNGGIFCHKNGSESCGTGKPENLTILFKQKSNSKINKLVIS